MVTKAVNHLKNMQKKGGSALAGTPQSGKAKAPPQVPPQNPQDNPKDAMALAITDVTAYATVTLGLLSSNKGQVVTTVNTLDSNDNGDKKMPALDTPPTSTVDTPSKSKDPLDQLGTVNMAPNCNITVRVIPSHTDATDDGLGTPWMSQGSGGGTPFLAAQSDIQFTSQADNTEEQCHTSLVLLSMYGITSVRKF